MDERTHNGGAGELAGTTAGWSGDDRQFRALIENAPDVIFVLSPAGRVIYASPAARRLMGHEPATLQGMELREVIHPEDLPTIFEAHEQALRNPGRPVRVPAYRIRRADGAVRWFSAVGTYITDDPLIHGVVVNARDITEQRELEAVTHAINEFATSLSALHSEQDILWEITRRCISSLGFEDCVVYLLDEERGVLVQRAAYGPKNPRDREIAAPLEIPLGRGIVGTAAQTGLVELVPDTRLDPRYLVDDAFRLSELAVPIVADGRVLGIIDAEHSRAGFFTTEHLTVLTSIASICANKLVRARAQRRLHELNRDLERRITERTAELVQANEQLKRGLGERRRAEQVQRALFEISEAVHAVQDLSSLYARIHEIIGTLMPAENFYLALFDEATGLVSFPYHRDKVDPPPAPRLARRGMTEYVLRTGRAALADLNEIQRLKKAGEYVQSGHPSAIWLGVPLTIRGRTFGVMAVQDHHHAAAFGEEEKRILSFVAGQTALAIERKRADEQLRAGTQRLRESEERFSKAFRAIPANVSLVRLSDQRFVEVNEAVLSFSGYAKEEIIGHTTIELNIWVEESERAEFYRRLKMEGCVRPFEARLRSKSGRIDTVIIAAEQIEVEGEPHILTLSVIISERKRAEEELLRSLARERELSRLKGEFVSLVSHEFRTPIGIIHSSAEILERYFARLPDTERTEHLKAIQSHAWRMAALMEEVLLFGKVEAGRLEFRPQPFNLGEACRRWTEEMELATESRCPIRLTLSEPTAPAVGDSDLLRHVISNLLSNAVKYSPPGRAVDFTVTRDGANAVFLIRDRGLGIPAADRGRLFSAFQRGENVRHLPGTGLGLVVIRRCLDLHQGTIELESEENVGTGVTVRMPLFKGEV